MFLEGAADFRVHACHFSQLMAGDLFWPRARKLPEREDVITLDNNFLACSRFFWTYRFTPPSISADSATAIMQTE